MNGRDVMVIIVMMIVGDISDGGYTGCSDCKNYTAAAAVAPGSDFAATGASRSGSGRSC